MYFLRCWFDVKIIMLVLSSFSFSIHHLTAMSGSEGEGEGVCNV